MNLTLLFAHTRASLDILSSQYQKTEDRLAALADIEGKLAFAKAKLLEQMTKESEEAAARAKAAV